MKRAISIFVCVLAGGMAAAQSPNVIQNTKAKMDTVSANATKASNQALGIKGPVAPAAAQGTSKPGAGAQAAPTSAPKPAVNAVKPAASAVKPAASASKKPAARKTAPATATKTAPAAAPKQAKPAPTAVKPVPATADSTASAVQPVPSNTEPANPDKEESKRANGKRDPFVSPVVSANMRSNCTAGKKCLEIGAINLRGVVRSESGFIAVVTNSLNKAYFLRENDPVFNGYVVKITGDSIVFQETVQDRLGKSFTREVVKRIFTPAV